MNEMLMVPLAEWERLKAKNRQSIGNNALVDKAGRVGAAEDILMASTSILDSMKVAIAKPLSQQRRSIVKRLKTGTVLDKNSSLPISDDDVEALVESPAEALLKRLIKVQKNSPATPTPAVIRCTIQPKRPRVTPKTKKKPRVSSKTPKRV